MRLKGNVVRKTTRGRLHRASHVNAVTLALILSEMGSHEDILSKSATKLIRNILLAVLRTD